MTKKPQTWWERSIARTTQFGLSGLSKIGMMVIIVVAFIATYLSALSVLLTLGFPPKPAMAIAILPDALMISSNARQRVKGLTPYQRLFAHKAMRFGMSVSLIINMLSGFLSQAPNGYWINSDSPRAVWMQHMIFILVIMAHALPVGILWYATEMLTRPANEPASLRSKRRGLIGVASWVLGLGNQKILAQNGAQAPASSK